MESNVMWKDPIVEEVRMIREGLAAKFGFDVEAIVRDAQVRQKASDHRILSFKPRKPKVSANHPVPAGKR